MTSPHEPAASARPVGAAVSDAASSLDVEARASTLVRRQLIVTALGVGLVVLVVAFARTQGWNEPTPSSPVESYLRAHQPPDPGSPYLAYVQLVVAGLVALVTLGHAAHVVAFVFRRKVL